MGNGQQRSLRSKPRVHSRFFSALHLCFLLAIICLCPEIRCRAGNELLGYSPARNEIESERGGRRPYYGETGPERNKASSPPRPPLIHQTPSVNGEKLDPCLSLLLSSRTSKTEAELTGPTPDLTLARKLCFGLNEGTSDDNTRTNRVWGPREKAGGEYGYKDLGGEVSHTGESQEDGTGLQDYLKVLGGNQNPFKTLRNEIYLGFVACNSHEFFAKRTKN